MSVRLMRQALTAALPIALVVVLLPGAARAQATGSLTGLVTDQSGAVLPGASVEAVSAATAQSRSAVAGEDGHFALPLLQPGTWEVRAALPGFRPAIAEVSVSVGDTTRVALTLAIGGVTDSVMVPAGAPLIETAHATLGITIDQQKLVELPLNGRNFTQLGTLVPGVVAPPAALGGASGDATPGGFGAVTAGFSVNGMRTQSNNFLLDGANNNDTFNTGFVMRPPPDAIQEFKIQTHSYSAELGRSAGSVVNVVTKSGSSVPHGAAWAFNRDDRLQARNRFAPAGRRKPRLTQHQFGGSLGGPIVKGRVFGFGYYEGYRNRRGNTTEIAVLSDAQRTGDFRGTAIRDPLTGVGFPDGRIPADRLDPAALALLERFVPRANSGASRYVASPETRDDRGAFGTRLDVRIDQRHSVLARYMRTATDTATPPITAAIGSRATATLTDYMASDTYIFSPRAINVARVSYNRIDAQPSITSGLSNEDFGLAVPNTNPRARGLAFINVAGLFTLGDAQQPFVTRVNEVLQIADDVTWTRGAHLIKAGVDVRRERMVIAFINRPNGDFTFNGVHTGSAAADFLLGLPSQFRRTTANQPQDGVGWLYAGYVQDEWRAAGRVTVSAGLRYELARPFVDARDALNAFHPGVQSVRFPAAPAGLVYPGDPGVPRGTYHADTNNLAPRTGVAWDVTGRGTATVRAGWGLFHDALAGQGDFFQNGVLAPPFTPLVEINAPPAPLTLRRPLSAVITGPAAFPPNLTIIGWGPDFRTPAAHHVNLTLQHRFGASVAAEAGYAGSRGAHLPIFMEVNPGLWSPGQTTVGRRLFPAFALVRPTFPAARSRYDSLQASLRARGPRGLHLLASYTLGHARDHVSGLNIGGEPRPVLPVVTGDRASVDRALAYEWGDALFDVRHRAVVSFGVELPAPRGLGRLVALAAGGWRLNGILQAQTGFPVTLTNPQLDIRYLTNRPDAICDPNDGAPRTTREWFRTSCLVARPLAQTGERPGTAGRNRIRGPGFAASDLSLTRRVPIRREHRIEIRIEAFNVFNQARYANPGGAIGTAGFGRISAAEDGRVVQLGMKYLF